MNVGHLFLLSALLVANVRCDCDKYIECFGEFLTALFTDIHSEDDKTNITDYNRTEIIDLTDHAESIDTVLSDITSLIENIGKNVIKTNVIQHNSNNTIIVVKTFEVGDDFKKSEPDEKFASTTDAITTDINILEELNLSDATTPSSPIRIEGDVKVIPLKNDKENEILTDPDIIDSLNSDDENFTDYPNIDYVEIYKDTTNENVEYVPTEPPVGTDSLRAEIDRQENEIENIIEHSVSVLNDEALKYIYENVTNHVSVCNFI